MTALLVAIPIAAATVPICVISYVAAKEGLPNGIELGGAFIYFGAAMLLVSIAGTLVGLPIVWMLRRSGFMSFPVLAASAALSGSTVSFLIIRTMPPFIGAVAGLAAAIVWWLIAERRTTLDA